MGSVKVKVDPLVRAAVRLDNEALNWLVTVSPVKAAELARALRDYNEATRARLTAIIESIDAMIPRDMHHEYSIGRNYSRVLFVQVVKTYLPDGFDLAALAARMKEIANGNAADEAWATKDTPHDFEFRIWWD